MNSRFDKWIIERRNEDGSLNFDAPQPETIFGMGAITGMTDDEMAKVIFRHKSDAIMDGRYIPTWPKLIDPMFSARRKTW